MVSDITQAWAPPIGKGWLKCAIFVGLEETVAMNAGGAPQQWATCHWLGDPSGMRGSIGSPPVSPSRCMLGQGLQEVESQIMAITAGSAVEHVLSTNDVVRTAAGRPIDGSSCPGLKLSIDVDFDTLQEIKEPEVRQFLPGDEIKVVKEGSTVLNKIGTVTDGNWNGLVKIEIVGDDASKPMTKSYKPEHLVLVKAIDADLQSAFESPYTQQADADAEEQAAAMATTVTDIATMTVPILASGVDGLSIACLHIVRKSMGEPGFTPENVETILKCTATVGLSLERSVLTDVITDASTSKSALLDLMRRDQKTYAPGLLLKNIVDAAYALMHAERVTLYVVDHISQEVWVCVSKDDLAGLTLPFGKGIAGNVAETGMSIVMEDCYTDPRFAGKEMDQKTGFTTKSMLCMAVPGYVENQPVAVVQVINKMPTHGTSFGPRDKWILDAFCIEISGMIQTRTLELALMKANASSGADRGLLAEFGGQMGTYSEGPAQVSAGASGTFKGVAAEVEPAVEGSPQTSSEPLKRKKSLLATSASDMPTIPTSTAGMPPQPPMAEGDAAAADAETPVLLGQSFARDESLEGRRAEMVTVNENGVAVSKWDWRHLDINFFLLSPEQLVSPLDYSVISTSPAHRALCYFRCLSPCKSCKKPG